MMHKIFIRERTRGRPLKELINSMANHLGAPVKYDQITVVETVDDELAHMVRVLASAKGELVDLEDRADDFADIEESEIENRFGAEESQQPAIETTEEGNGSPIITSADVEPPDPPAKRVRKPRTYQPKPCDVCGQMYTPTGPRQVGHGKDCPGKKNGSKPAREALAKKPVANGETIPPWRRLKNGSMYENTLLQKLVRDGAISVGEQFENEEVGLHEVVNRGLKFSLVPVKKPAPVGDPE